MVISFCFLLDIAGSSFHFGQVELVPALLSRALRVAMKESRTAVARAESLEAAAPDAWQGAFHDIPRYCATYDNRSCFDFGSLVGWNDVLFLDDIVPNFKTKLKNLKHENYD